MPQPRIPQSRVRIWLFYFISFLFIVLIVRSFTSLSAVGVTLLRGKWSWILLAALLHIFYFGPYTLIYTSLFRAVGVESKFRHLLPLVFATVFINAAIPSGGVSGVALFVEDAVTRNQSGTRVAAATVLVLIADLITLIPFLILGALALYARHTLRVYDLAGGAIFLAYTSLLIALFLLAWQCPRSLQALLTRLTFATNWMGRFINKPQLLPANWPIETTQSFAEAMQHLLRRQRHVYASLWYAFAAHVISLASLYCLFVAYGQPVNLGVATAGFGFGIVFWVITIIPHGIAAVEEIMGLIFTANGIPPDTALAITLAFRAVNFYLPLALGFVLLRYTSLFHPLPEKSGIKPFASSSR